MKHRFERTTRLVDCMQARALEPTAHNSLFVILIQWLYSPFEHLTQQRYTMPIIQSQVLCSAFRTGPLRSIFISEFGVASAYLNGALCVEIKISISVHSVPMPFLSRRRTRHSDTQSTLRTRLLRITPQCCNTITIHGINSNFYNSREEMFSIDSSRKYTCPPSLMCLRIEKMTRLVNNGLLVLVLTPRSRCGMNIHINVTVTSRVTMFLIFAC